MTEKPSLVAREAPLTELRSPARRIVASGVAASFQELPFAGAVGGWRLQDQVFLWVRFSDGAYWLVTESQHYAIEPRG